MKGSIATECDGDVTRGNPKDRIHSKNLGSTRKNKTAEQSRQFPEFSRLRRQLHNGATPSSASAVQRFGVRAKALGCTCIAQGEVERTFRVKGFGIEVRCLHALSSSRFSIVSFLDSRQKIE